MTDTPPRKAVQKAADDRLALYDALLCLKTRAEVDAFLADLCTPSAPLPSAGKWRACLTRAASRIGRSPLKPTPARQPSFGSPGP
jgi:hypothetical protein